MTTKYRSCFIRSANGYVLAFPSVLAAATFLGKYTVAVTGRTKVHISDDMVRQWLKLCDPGEHYPIPFAHFAGWTLWESANDDEHLATIITMCTQPHTTALCDLSIVPTQQLHNQATSQPTNQATSQPTNHTTNQLINCTTGQLDSPPKVPEQFHQSTTNSTGTVPPTVPEEFPQSTGTVPLNAHQLPWDDNEDTEVQSVSALTFTVDETKKDITTIWREVMGCDE